QLAFDAGGDVPGEEFVVGARLGEPGLGATVGGPGRLTFAAPGRVDQVAGLTVLLGHREDLAAELDEHAFGGRRGREAAGIPFELLPARAQPRPVVGEGDLELAQVLGRLVHHPQLAAGLEDHAAPAATRPQDVEVVEGGDLPRLVGAGIEAVEVEGAGPVGGEVDAVAEPERVVVRALKAGPALDAVRGEVVDVDVL